MDFEAWRNNQVFSKADNNCGCLIARYLIDFFNYPKSITSYIKKYADDYSIIEQLQAFVEDYNIDEVHPKRAIENGFCVFRYIKNKKIVFFLAIIYNNRYYYFDKTNKLTTTNINNDLIIRKFKVCQQQFQQ